MKRKILMILMLLSVQVCGQSFKDLQKELNEKKGTSRSDQELNLLNVSFDPTREFYEEINEQFIKWWKESTGQTLTIYQSHGGSGKQARAVSQGLPADVVTLATAFDINAIQKFSKVLPENWADRLPNHSVPFISTIVFLVREGNPKQIKDWDDLVKTGIGVITPNPKTSGGARWNYLAAWGFASKKFKGDHEKIKEFMGNLFKNVPVLDTGARNATTTFVQREMGDVLITWENEAYLAMKELGQERFDIVVPSISIKAEPPVAWIDAVNEKKGTGDAARHYLAFLYTKEAQGLAGKHFYRPLDKDAAEKYKSYFPEIELLEIDRDFGGWDKVHQEHFKEGGVFDQLYEKK